MIGLDSGYARAEARVSSQADDGISLLDEIIEKISGVIDGVIENIKAFIGFSPNKKDQQALICNTISCLEGQKSLEDRIQAATERQQRESRTGDPQRKLQEEKDLRNRTNQFVTDHVKSKKSELISLGPPPIGSDTTGISLKEFEANETLNILNELEALNTLKKLYPDIDIPVNC